MKEDIQPKEEKLDAEDKSMSIKKKCIYNTMILKTMYFHFSH